MTQRGRRVRWLLGPILAALLIWTPYAIASAQPNLPRKSATDILALMARGSAVHGFTGTLAQVSNLGLPDIGGALPGGQGTSAGNDVLTNTISTLSTNQRARVSVAPTGTRLQLYTDFGERDLVLNRGNLWLWNYGDKSVTHVSLPTLPPDTTRRLHDLVAVVAPKQPLYTPQDLAAKLLRGLDNHTRVSVGQQRYVAEQAVYTLLFTPREQASLVNHIEVAIDAKTGFVLRVSIYADDMTAPAYTLGYSSISYGVPPEAIFAFTPPPGAKVTNLDYGNTVLAKSLAGDGTDLQDAANSILTVLGGAAAAGSQVRIDNDGWASTITLPPGTVKPHDKTIELLTSAGDSGTRVLRTALVTGVVHSDGSVSLGAVSVDRLNR